MKNIITLALIIFTNLSLAGDGAHGGGLGEKNVVFAFYSLENNLALCLRFTECGINDWERGMLNSIQQSLVNRTESITQLSFVSETQKPGTFVLNGVVRSALTGSNVGDKIIINIDHLYRKDSTGIVRAISVTEASSLLVHELSHHNGIGDEPEELKLMDILCSKLSAFLSVHLFDLPENITIPVTGVSDQFTCELNSPEIFEKDWRTPGAYFLMHRLGYGESRHSKIDVTRTRAGQKLLENGDTIVFTKGIVNISNSSLPYNINFISKPALFIPPNKQLYFIYVFAVRTLKSGEYLYHDGAKRRAEFLLVDIGKEDEQISNRIEEIKVTADFKKPQNEAYKPKDKNAWLDVPNHGDYPDFRGYIDYFTSTFLMTRAGEITALTESLWTPAPPAFPHKEDVLIDCRIMDSKLFNAN